MSGTEQIQLIVGKTADPAFLKKLTYIGQLAVFALFSSALLIFAPGIVY